MVKKEGQLAELNWVWEHRIWDEERAAALEDRFAREPVFISHFFVVSSETLTAADNFFIAESPFQ